jgi:hypothetical protein
MAEDSETNLIVYLFRKGDRNNGEAIDGLEQYGVTSENSGHYREVTFPDGSTKQQGMSADTEFGLTHVTLPNGLVLNLSTCYEDQTLIVHHFDVGAESRGETTQELQSINQLQGGRAG